MPSNPNAAYVYTGVGSIHTENGVRASMRDGGNQARPFTPSPVWLRRHTHMLRCGRLMLATDWETGALERETGASLSADEEE